jgi:hypothetical protein
MLGFSIIIFSIKILKLGKPFTMPSRKKWEIKKDGILILTQFSQIKRKEIEYVEEFNMIFDTLIKEFFEDLIPKDRAILLYQRIVQYIHAFEGQFGLILRNKFPSIVVTWIKIS